MMAHTALDFGLQVDDQLVELGLETTRLEFVGEPLQLGRHRLAARLGLTHDVTLDPVQPVDQARVPGVSRGLQPFESVDVVCQLISQAIFVDVGSSDVVTCGSTGEMPGRPMSALTRALLPRLVSPTTATTGRSAGARSVLGGAGRDSADRACPPWSAIPECPRRARRSCRASRLRLPPSPSPLRSPVPIRRKPTLTLIPGAKSRRSAGSDRGPQKVVGVLDDVAVPLLGEEPLPVRGIFGVQAVTGHHRVEDGAATVGLGTEQPPQPLRLLLA